MNSPENPGSGRPRRRGRAGLGGGRVDARARAGLWRFRTSGRANSSSVMPRCSCTSPRSTLGREPARLSGRGGRQAGRLGPGDLRRDLGDGPDAGGPGRADGDPRGPHPDQEQLPHAPRQRRGVPARAPGAASLRHQADIALDRLEASLAASGTGEARGGPGEQHAAADPRELRAGAPDPDRRAPPSCGRSPAPQFERVINTHALILRPQGSSTYYLHVYDGWLYAGTLEGPWYQPMVLPPGIDQVAQSLAKSGLVDLIDGGKVQPKPSLANGVPRST